MAGFYVHIPYCRQACIYCNFHFSTSRKTEGELWDAIVKEISDRRYYIENETVETIYFGGGTPSIVPARSVERLLDAIYKNYALADGEVEITLEANPDDLNSAHLQALRKAGINRLSIGIQSFHAADLKWLNRAHNAEQSIECLYAAAQAGFSNISVDLIFGIPGQSDQQWMENLEMVKKMNITHFSAYSLTEEPKTAMAAGIAKGEIPPMDEEQMARQFTLSQKWAPANGYVPYEISNYGKPGHFSKHNTAYWQQKRYIGVGPSAHSYHLGGRQWNVANNAIYTRNVLEGKKYFETEELSVYQAYNEYVMTALRTIWGCDRKKIQEWFGDSFLQLFDHVAADYISENFMLQKDNIVTLTLAGKLIADKIMADLFVLPPEN